MLKKLYNILLQIIAIIIILVVTIVGFKISWWLLKLAYSKFIEAFSML